MRASRVRCSRPSTRGAFSSVKRALNGESSRRQQDAKFRQISRGTNHKKNVRDIGNGCSGLGEEGRGGCGMEWNGMEF